MKKIAIIGANEFQNPLILKAKQLGYETHVFAWKSGSIGEQTADYFYPISIVEKEKILEECKKIGIDGITTIASDLATVTVTYVASAMGLYGNSVQCCKKSTNKYLMRQALRDGGIDTIKFVKVTNEVDYDKIKDLEFPLIVKPTDRSGSRSITKVTSVDEVKEAVLRAQNDSFENCAIVEEFIEGKEYSAEGISFKGEHTFLTVTEKRTTGAPNFIETGHIQPATLSDEMKKKIYSELKKALDALEIKNGATHSEFKITPDGRVRVIEIGARMGGDCIGSDLVMLSTGYDFVKMVIDVAMGVKPSFDKIGPEQISAIKFIFNKEDLKQFEAAKSRIPECIYRASEIEDIESHKVVDSSSRFGFYILKTDEFDKIGWLFGNE
jgi:biotin carboxylase